jgi:PadR family transcriptional regulator, regulatory protein PadR
LTHSGVPRGASDGLPLPPTHSATLEGDQPESAAQRRPGRQLLHSALLLLLAEKPRHGYALTNAVAELGLGEMDRPRIYRALADLDLHGLVKVWDETSQTGHTRKVYSVTDCGHDALRSAVTTVAHDRDALDNFLQRYQRITARATPSEPRRCDKPETSARDNVKTISSSSRSMWASPG